MVGILAEIVGGYNLKRSTQEGTASGRGDEDCMKPYCMVHVGKALIHQTKKAEGGRNPVWTVSTGSFFNLEIPDDDIEKKVLKISVWYKQKDSLQLTVLETCCLGRVDKKVSDIFLTHCDEKRVEMDLCDPVTKEKTGNGVLTLRFRMSTSYDKRYLSLLNTEPRLLKQRSVRPMGSNSARVEATETPLLVTEANETDVAGASFLNVLSSALTTKSYVDQSSGQTVFLAKPHPDPNRVEQTTYLSANDIVTQTMAPSKQWLEAGSGGIGKVYVEVLSCHDLPNMDVGGEAMGNVTVFEDALVQTPVIDDELSPHWLPWTSRAFLFRMMHPASNLYVAAFDFDLGLSAHDAIGRVAVNLANFQPDTEYTLKYNMFPSSNVTDRNAAGSITLRIRVEYEDHKRALLETLKPIPKFHINVRKEKSLSVLRYTCFGEYGDDTNQEFDLTVVRSYINEILEYKRAVSYYCGDAFRSLMFWRGQVKIGNVSLPVHSMLFYLFASTLVERPYLFPPFLLLSISWVMIANQLEREQHPSPWHRCPSLWHFVDILRNRDFAEHTCNIDPFQGAADADAHEKSWRERLERDQEFAAKQAAMQQEIMDLGDEAIQTKVESMIPLDLLVRLARYQAIVGRICAKFRMVKIVLTWEESYLSFWITACFLVSGLVSLLLPWSFILLWTGRLIVWGFFGPHMKFVDLILQATGDGKDVLQEALEKYQKESLGARIRRQEALKIRDMKCLAFGKYITLVPSHNLSRHFDRALPESFARSFVRPDSQPVIAPRGVPGQHLFGTVLPRTEHENLVHEDEMARIVEANTAIRKKLVLLQEEADMQQQEDIDESLTIEGEFSVRPTGDESSETPVLETGNEETLDAEKVLPRSTCATESSPSDVIAGSDNGQVKAKETQTPEFFAQLRPSSKNLDLFSSAFGWLGNNATALNQLDEERELDGVEVVLSTSLAERDDFEADGSQQDDGSVGGMSTKSKATPVVYFQPIEG